MVYVNRFGVRRSKRELQDVRVWKSAEEKENLTGESDSEEQRKKV